VWCVVRGVINRRTRLYISLGAQKGRKRRRKGRTATTEERGWGVTNITSSHAEEEKESGGDGGACVFLALLPV